jgi:hypothetical protein
MRERNNKKRDWSKKEIIKFVYKKRKRKRKRKRKNENEFEFEFEFEIQMKRKSGNFKREIVTI